MANLDSANVSQDQTHQANHQADTKSSSSSTTSAQNHQSFEATTAVLDTNELLHMIIAEVPLMNRTSIRGVSKPWKTAVTKIGFTLEPVSHQQRRPDAPATRHPDRRDFLEHRVGLPMLSSVAIFVINPVFLPSNRPPHDGRRGYYAGFIPSASEILGVEQQFITNPPLTQVFMSTGGGNGAYAAILRVHGGIRLGDLAEYPKKMLPNHSHPHRRVSWSFGKEGSAYFLEG
jgi:hypothetical protein